MVETQEPQGIAFFNVKSGETHYCKLEPTIAAYINSSDMGINASREQDFGWKLSSEWVKRVKVFRRDPTQMAILTAGNQGRKVTTLQILYYLYGEELRAYHEDLEENENPFEEQYLQEISGRPQPAAPAPLPNINEDDEDISEFVDDADLVPTLLTPEEQKIADDIALAEMEAEEKANTVKVEDGKMTVPKSDGKTSVGAKPTQK